MDTEARVVTPTICRLCGKQFPSNPLHSAVLLNANPQAKIQQMQALLSPLMKHLQQKHAHQLQWTTMLGGEYAGLLALNFFQCSEPAIEEQRDFTRWKVHQQTRRAVVNDERIVERLRQSYINAMVKSHLTPPPDDQQQDAADKFMETPLAAAVIETMQAMRDVLEERGRYQMPEPPSNQAQANGSQTAPAA